MFRRRSEFAVCLAAVAVFFCMALTGCRSSFSSPGGDGGKATREIYAMNTIMSLTAYGDSAAQAIEKGVAVIHRLESAFSVTDPNSDIAKLNAAGGKAVKVSEETYELIRLCMDISEETDGCFDISIYPLVKAWGFTTESMHVPTERERREALSHVDYRKIRLLGNSTVQLEKGMEIDLGAVAKGYLSGKLMEVFQENNVVSAIVSLGGNVQTMRGSREDSGDFVVGITDPGDGSSVYGTIKVRDKAVITSGIYQRYFEENGIRYHHIMDKRTGKPAENTLSSVTVIGTEGWRADALATALYVMGEERAKQYQKENPDIGMILIRKDGSFWQSEGLDLQRR